MGTATIEPKYKNFSQWSQPWLTLLTLTSRDGWRRRSLCPCGYFLLGDVDILIRGFWESLVLKGKDALKEGSFFSGLQACCLPQFRREKMSWRMASLMASSPDNDYAAPNSLPSTAKTPNHLEDGHRINLGDSRWHWGCRTGPRSPLNWLSGGWSRGWDSSTLCQDHLSVNRL